MASATFSKKVFRYLKSFGFIGFGKKNNIYGINPLVISTLYIGLTLLLASLLRRIVKSTTDCCESIYRQILLEFVATLELCATCFELIIVADNWGVGAYSLYLFLLTLWWSTHWEDASACPYTAIEDVLEGRKDVQTAALVIVAQVVAALITFRYVQVLWALELVETHSGKAYEDCTADLQVSMLEGAVIEGSATCICRLMSKSLSECNARFGTVLDAIFGTMMVVAAFNFSGGYFNPALATSLKLGCAGNTFKEHFVVYWLGATIGSVMSVFLFKINSIENCLQEDKEKTE